MARGFLWTGFRAGATILAQILHTKTDKSPVSCAEIARPDAVPILLVTHEYAPFRGGVATYVRELARAAGRRHERVEVWTVDYRDRFKESRVPGDEREDTAVPVVRLPSDGRLTPAGLGRLARGLWRRRHRWNRAPVVLMSVGAQMVFFLLAFVPGLVDARRVVPFFHGSEILRFARSRFWRPLARRFYARAGGFGVTSLHVESLLRGSGLLPPGAAVTLAPCALPTAFVEQAGEPAVAREAEAGGEWRVLTVARLHPRKGQLDVARALGRLPAEMRARLVYQIVGVGAENYRRAVAAACRDAGVQVEFLGAVGDRRLAGVYAGATLYVQASRTLARSVEGFGITFLEASFHGCAVAAYRSGGVGEAVLDGETGLLVAEGDEAALAEAIRRLLEDGALRGRLGQRGREFARSFRWEDAAAALCATARRALVKG